MRFGSVCSGIEAASVAWHPLGWEAAWLSEIEPFPCAVLKHHYPDVPNYGDMTLLPDRILSGEVEAPDLFCGGTPCQAFSVAGLRNSLDDARGNLSLTFVGIANAIDHVRSVRRDAPAIIFWENVPGVLNTKDNAFGCFLGALAGETEQIVPSGDKWTNSGCVFGPQRTVAWRVLDAQYFGVAQRRRRVFVVASARDDFNPAEVLFEFEGVRRDIAPSRQAREEVAGTIAARFGISRNNIEECVSVVGALDTECGGNRMNHQTINSGHLLPVSSFYESSIAQYRKANVSGTIKASGGVAGGGSETFLAQPVAVYENHPADSRVKEMGEVCSTVVSRWGTGGGNLPMVSQPIPLNTMTIQGRPSDEGRMGSGIGEPGDPCPTLTKAHSHAVAQPIAYSFDSLSSNSMKSSNPHSGCNSVDVSRSLDTSRGLDPSCNQGGIGVAQPIAFEPGKMKRLGYGDAEPGLAPTLRAEAGDNQLAIAHPMVLMDQGGSAMNVQTDGTVGTLRRETHGHEPVVMQPVCLGGQHPNAGIGIDQAPTLTSAMGAGGGHVPIVSMAVRRLTPTECERLQGFPDGYTNIPWRKAAESPDGPRYKALGNSWAVPVVRWIGQRIQERITT